RAEKIIGEVLDRTKRRKDVYLVTKNTAYRKSMGTGVTKMFEHRLNASLERLRTDHVDCYYLHGLAGNQIELLRDPGVKAAFETLKQQGKTRFCGLSCHDARLPEILDTAAECGWIDQVMFKYNFRDVGGRDRHDELQRAIDKAAKANLGLIAIKTQGGAINFPDKMKQLQEKGFKKEVAAVKSVWMDGRIHVAVSEMTTRSDLRENVAASAEPELSSREWKLLDDYRQTTAHLYCHGSGTLRDRGPGRSGRHGSPLPSVLRDLRQTPRSPRALPGASAGRPRPRGRQPRRRCRRLSPRPARRRAHRTRGSADESLNRPA
ncbi:MAG: aldo/keto reductase, partial [Isosphaeraceae bacterium]